MKDSIFQASLVSQQPTPETGFIPEAPPCPYCATLMTQSWELTQRWETPGPGEYVQQVCPNCGSRGPRIKKGERVDEWSLLNLDIRNQARLVYSFEFAARTSHPSLDSTRSQLWAVLRSLRSNIKKAAAEGRLQGAREATERRQRTIDDLHRTVEQQWAEIRQYAGTINQRSADTRRARLWLVIGSGTTVNRQLGIFGFTMKFPVALEVPTEHYGQIIAVLLKPDGFSIVQSDTPPDAPTTITWEQ